MRSDQPGSLRVAETREDESDRSYDDAYRGTADGCARASTTNRCRIYVQKGIEANTLQSIGITGLLGTGVITALAVTFAVVPRGGGVKIGTNGTSIEVSGAW